ncbi:MAG: SDR family oxidoreductase [Pseudomonadota bacterium]
MLDTALITGASSGIGRKIALYHASQGGNLILTARREDRLEELKAQIEKNYSVKVHVIAADIGKPEGPEKLIAAVDEAGLKVDILVNNAGYGGHGRLIDREIKDEIAMIDLNVVALVKLTHEFAARMAKQGSGKILNVGSTAGFVPGPTQAVYFATKAFVNSFSQAVDHEMRPHGVTCTVLAPGYVETEFAKVANLEGTAMTKSGATPKDVAEIGYHAMMKGKLVAINEWGLSFFIQWVVPFLPRRMVMSMMERMQAKN